MAKYINEVSGAPQAIGPYSQAVEANGFLFLSGQIPINPATATLVEGGIESQTVQVLNNITAVLSDQKLSFADVVKTTIFLTDFSHFKTVNEIYAKTLNGVRPARSTIQVVALPLGSLIEIEMVATLK